MGKTARTHRPLPLVRTVLFLPFLNFLTRLGTPVDRLLQAAKLPISPSDDPDTLIPLRNVYDFLDVAARREGIDNLGFQVGLATPITALGDFGLLIRRSVTLWDALHTAQTLVSTMSTGFRLRIEQTGSSAWIYHDNLVAEASGSGHGDAFGTMLLVNLIRTVATDRWRPTAVRLPMPHDHTVADLDVFRVAALQFGQAASAIAVPTTLLSESLRRETPRDLAETGHLDQHLTSSAPSQELCGSVTQFLLSQLPYGSTDISAAAEATGLSVRTLQRQLWEEGCDYSRLLEQTRFRLAVDLLRNADIKVVDIALELGYRDAANFTRAFRRWTGISPMRFRDTA